MNKKRDDRGLAAIEIEKVKELLFADTDDLSELAKIAGADPRTFYRGANFRDADLTDENLESFDLAFADLSQCITTSKQRQYIKKFELDYLAQSLVYPSRELFTMDAWHPRFETKGARTDLYVRVNFDKSEIAVESVGEGSFNFDIELRAATITVYIPAENGFEIEFTSVSIGGKRQEESGTQIANKNIQVNQQRNPDNISFYLKPTLEAELLKGNPWPNSEPVVAIVDKTANDQKEVDFNLDTIAPIVVTMSCRREDLVISFKNIPQFLGDLDENKRNIRLAAAESFIKSNLTNGTDDSNENIELGSVFATAI